MWAPAHRRSHTPVWCSGQGIFGDSEIIGQALIRRAAGCDDAASATFFVYIY